MLPVRRSFVVGKLFGMDVVLRYSLLGRFARRHAAPVGGECGKMLVFEEKKHLQAKLHCCATSNTE
jgi:hypothetical protein